MPTIKITRKSALQALASAVFERGSDYKYERIVPPHRPNDDDQKGPACYYWHGVGPGCIVGYVLHFLGVSVEVIQSCDGAGTVDALVDDLREQDVHMTQAALVTLSAAQIAQDNGWSWGEALARAVATVGK